MHLDRGLTWAKHIKTKRKQLNLKAKKCTGYWEDQHYQQNANSSYTKQYSNPYGPMEFSYGRQPPIPTWKSSSSFNARSILNAPCYINDHQDP
jgi:hypothetical protein